MDVVTARSYCTSKVVDFHPRYRRQVGYAEALYTSTTLGLRRLWAQLYWLKPIFSSFSTCYLQLRAHFTSIHLREALRKRLHETESHRSPLPLTFAFTIYGSHLENSASSPLTLTLPLESPCSNEQSSAMIPALHFHPVASSVRLASLVSWVLYKTLFPKRSFGCPKYPLPT